MLQKLVTVLFLSGEPLSLANLAKILVTNEDEIKKNVEGLE
jgi:chromosome segregation and condensation protein ScpB